METKCSEHSGFEERIKKNEKETDDIWIEINKLRDRDNSILTRFNITLGGICLACVLLALNIIIEWVKKGGL